MEDFGITDPRKMPEHFFHESVDRDYSSATRADISKQHYTVCPRHWYFDVTLVCEDCRENFIWSVQDQRCWFETLGHCVESQAGCCRSCSDRRQRIKQLCREYERIATQARVWGRANLMVRVIEIVDALAELGFQISPKMAQDRFLFERSVYK